MRRSIEVAPVHLGFSMSEWVMGVNRTAAREKAASVIVAERCERCSLTS